MSFEAALREPLLSREEERAALHAWQVDRDRQALDRLVRSHARQAWAEARRWTDNPVHLEDLAAEGVVGLIQAAGNFDLSMDVRFGTFAAWSVRNRIMAVLGSVTAVIDVPARTLINARSTRADALYQDEALAALARVESLDDGDDEGRGRASAVAWDGLSPEEEVTLRSAKDQVRCLLEEALASLDPAEREIIRRRLDDDMEPDDMPPAARSRQREIERRAMHRLRRILQGRGFSFTMFEQ
jgi:RNA polymerase sigma factor (sigma-70 family)